MSYDLYLLIVVVEDYRRLVVIALGKILAHAMENTRAAYNACGVLNARRQCVGLTFR